MICSVIVCDAVSICKFKYAKSYYEMMQEFAVHNILSQPLPSFPQAWQANTTLALCGIHAVWHTVENHLPVQVRTKGVRILVQRLPIHCKQQNYIRI